MFAIIKNNKISGFSDIEITQEEQDFDELIEGDFDANKTYEFINGVVIRVPSELLEFVNTATKDEILTSELDFTQLGIKKRELGKLASDKFCDGNIYKEFELHRVMLEILMANADFTNITPEHYAKLQELGAMTEQVKIFLEKFNPSV